MSGFVVKAFNAVWKGCVGVGMLAAAAAVALYYFQENILYIPSTGGQMSKLTSGNQKGYVSPSEYSTNGKYRGSGQGQKGTAPPIPFVEAYVPTPDGERIHVWLMYHPRTQGQKPLPTLVIRYDIIFDI
jgi:hypothetical protein